MNVAVLETIVGVRAAARLEILKSKLSDSRAVRCGELTEDGPAFCYQAGCPECESVRS